MVILEVENWWSDNLRERRVQHRESDSKPDSGYRLSTEEDQKAPKGRRKPK